MKVLYKKGPALDNDLHSIGINLATTESVRDSNIETTLIAGSIEAVLEGNTRNGALIIDWLSEHHLRINVDRLTSLISDLDSVEFKWVKIFWCANAQRIQKVDIRFKRLAALFSGKRYDYADRFSKPSEHKVTDMFIKMKGEDERFSKTCMRLPKNQFPSRPSQIFSADHLAKTHMPFRYRVMFGPSYRADIWALLRRNSDLTAYRLAKLAGCSYPAAYRVKRDYEIVKRDYSTRGKVA